MISAMIPFGAAVTGTARIAPTTPSRVPPTSTLAIVAKPERLTAAE